MKKQYSIHHYTPNTQSGMTLIEVLIAMFVLAIGVLALLAVQLRSVSSVREAESQTIVSQITQNLIEGMLINPKVFESTRTDATGQAITNAWPEKNYDHYLVSSQAAMRCIPDFKKGMRKEALAAVQICNFQNDLATTLPETTVYFAICRDSSGATPTITNGNFNANCDGSGDVTVVKTAWLKELEADADHSKSSLNTSDDNVVYTYQARVAD